MTPAAGAPGTPDDVADAVTRAVADAYRAEWGRVVATLIRVTGDWDLAEECAQDAFARAVERWPHDGVPRSPGAWLTTTARNAATDRIRRAATGRRKVAELTAIEERTMAAAPDLRDDSGIVDDRLRLVFTCCHPALALDTQVALTLREMVGLTTAEVAHAFLVPEPTVAQRLVRAKRKIVNAGIPYRVPPREQLPERLDAVLGVVYLLFNEGYSASAGDALVRGALCDEAIRLCRTIAELLPDEPEVLGLLALMLLHDSRRATRTDAHGDLVLLEDQDRTRWDHDAIRAGLAALDAAVALGRPGPYQLQAAIAACHAQAPDRGGHRLAADRRALRRARPRHRLTGGGAQPRGRGRHGRRARRRTRAARTARRVGRARRLPPSPRGAGRPAAPGRAVERSRRRPTTRRWRWSPTRPSAASSNDAGPPRRPPRSRVRRPAPARLRRLNPHAKRPRRSGASRSAR